MPNPYLALAAITSGIAVVSVGNGLITVFLSVRMTLEAFSTPAIGAVVAGYSIGFLIGCRLVQRVIRQVGHIRAFAVFAALMSASSLAFPALVTVPVWVGLRIVTGFAAAGLFVVAESWLNEKTPTESRGRVFSVYMIATKSAYGAGQLLLMIGDPAGLALFMLAAACFSLCLVPVSLTRAQGPGVPDLTAYGLRKLYQVSPVAVVGCVIAGMNNTSVVGIGPVYAARIGLDVAQIAWFTAAIQFGALALQYPIGRLSDRFDRRRVMLGSAFVTSVLALTVIAVGGGPFWLLLGLAALYGGVSFTIYPVGVAHAADHVQPQHVVAVSGGLLMAWAAGSVVGPMLVTTAMRYGGPGGLFAVIAVQTALLGLFILWRMLQREPPETQARFVAPPQTSPAAAELDPRAGGAD